MIMKKNTLKKVKSLLFIFVFSITVFTFQSFKKDLLVSKYVSAEPLRSTGPASSGLGNRTGGPGSSNSTCSTCHAGGSFNPTISLIVKDLANATVTNYTPGQTYNLEYVITNGPGLTSQYGFQSIALDASNNTSGNFQNTGSNVQIVNTGSNQFVEQNFTSTSNSFSTQWVAPAAGSGSVTFYAAGNSVNNSGSTGGDQGTPAYSITLTENTLNIDKNSFKNSIVSYPNPSSGYINIELKNSSNKVSFKVFDNLGKLVLENKHLFSNFIPLDMSKNPSGLYFIYLKTDKGESAIIKHLIL